MVHDRRLSFTRKWLERAKKADDVFDCFFSVWIALVIAAQRLSTKSGRYVEDDTDRERVLEYFRANTIQIIAVLSDRETEMGRLARRRGSRFSNPILDTGNPELRKAFSRLSRAYTAEERIADAELVVTVGEIVNKVRNSVFHGVKVYDAKEDLEVLALVNPILLQIVETCERGAG